MDTDDIVLLSLGFVAGLLLGLSEGWGDVEKLSEYRLALIRAGAAEYRTDSKGEPQFIIKPHLEKP